jgi:hypothetical protein
MQVTHVNKVLGPVGLVVVSLYLRELVLMMRENKIDPTRVNVHLIPQNRARHRRTFDVPSGSALSPGGLPLWLSGLCIFPQREILFVSLLVLLVCLLCLSLSLRDSLQLPILELLAVGLDVKIDRSVRLICIPVLNNFFDISNDLRDVLCDSSDRIGRFHS